MRKVYQTQTRRALIGLLTFVATAAIAVIVNSFRYGFHVSYSISRYVGCDVWSVVLFALGNALVVAMMARLLWELGHAWKMPRIFYWCSLLLCVALVWLSVCPLGLMDYFNVISTVSLLHTLGSRTLFVMMLLIAAMIVRNKLASNVTRGASAVFVVYGLFCVTGFLTRVAWFSAGTLVFETAYILGFMSLLLICRSKK